ncbi:MAG: putative suppressor of deltex [Streblomastix strix]|uniref:HECT-type E3 ubiquitin transferase n=1 Tax=Streblomastix strix TaxID=222440 RepID=A0A5J4V3C1_9EUKA|nr:MAG: putative suppressor of deltex [Streblomastix strix]
MLCGVDQIDLEDWKANTDYIGGYRSNSPQILFFWDMILGMCNEQRAQLLQFATGTTLLPPGGFMNLMGSMGPRKFTIYRSTKGTQYLPNVHICFKLIDHPPYQTNEIYMQMLNYRDAAYDSKLNQIDPNDPTTIDRSAYDEYSHFDLIRTFSYGGISLPATVQQIFTPVPPRRQIKDIQLRQINHIIYHWVHCVGEFPDPLSPVGDSTSKHIQPPPTSGLQPSRFFEPCFALSMLKRGNALDRQIVTNESTIIPPPAFHHQPFVEPYPNGMSVMGVTIQIKLKQLQKDQRDAELEEDFQESQYGSNADSDGRKPKYQLIKEKDDEIMGRGQGGEKYDWGIDWEGYDVCEEDETLLKIDVDIKTRAAGIPGTQEIVPIPPLQSAKVDPQREKDIQIELLDNEKKLYLGQQRYIDEISGVVLNIDFEKRELMLADGSLVPYDMLIKSAGLQDQPLKRLSQPIAEKNFHVDVTDGAITMNDEADAIRLQRFIHKPTQPGGKKWLEDEDEICAIYGATLRAYSVLHGLLQVDVPGKRLLLFIKQPADPDANSLNHERRIDAGKKYLSEAGVKIVDGWNAISAHSELGKIPIGPDDEEY